MNHSYKFKLQKKGNNNSGYLIPFEINKGLSNRYIKDNDNKIFFETGINRIFYIYEVPVENSRGSHAYYNTKQILICICGNLKVRCFDGEKEQVYELNKPDEALYIDPHVWRTSFDHSCDAVLLVLSSLEYNEEDYIRDYDKFMEVVKCI